jgi:hypothetical protein
MGQAIAIKVPCEHDDLCAGGLASCKVRVLSIRDSSDEISLVMLHGKSGAKELGALKKWSSRHDLLLEELEIHAPAVMVTTFWDDEELVWRHILQATEGMTLKRTDIEARTKAAAKARIDAAEAKFQAEAVARRAAQDSEALQDEKVARAAFAALGVVPQPCSINYFSDGMARVTLLGDGRSAAFSASANACNTPNAGGRYAREIVGLPRHGFGSAGDVPLPRPRVSPCGCR